MCEEPDILKGTKYSFCSHLDSVEVQSSPVCITLQVGTVQENGSLWGFVVCGIYEP